MSHSCCVAGPREKVDWLRDFARLQKMGVEMACEYDTSCAKKSSSSAQATAVVAQQPRRITPTLVRPGLPATATPTPAPQPSLEHRTLKVTPSPVGPTQRLVQISRRLHELTALTRKMKAMSRESLRAAVLAGTFPLPSDITMERTVLLLERRALIDDLEAKPTTTRTKGGGTKTKKPSSTRKWTSKQVLAMTNWLATLESRWVERLEHGMVAQLVMIQPHKDGAGDDRVDALLKTFARLHPSGIYQPLEAKVTRESSAILELAANKSLLGALAKHGVRVRGYVAMGLSGNRRAVRPVMCSCVGGMVRYDAPQSKSDERAAALVAAAVESLIAPQPRKKMAAPIKPVKSPPPLAAKKALPTKKRQRVLESQ
jgi:hypothetical protein